MFKYIVKRLLLSILILLGISIILYILIRLMPDDFVSKQIQNIVAGGSEVTQEMIDALYEAYGLNGTWAEGYINWLGNFVTGKLGRFLCLRPSRRRRYRSVYVDILRHLRRFVGIPIYYCNSFGSDCRYSPVRSR